MALRVYGVSDGAIWGYRSRETYPWDELEKIVGVTFNDEARNQIFSAASWFFDNIVATEQANLLSEVEGLREEISKAAYALTKIHNRIYEDAKTDNLFHSLCWLKGGDLRSVYASATSAVDELQRILSLPNDDGIIVDDVRSARAHALMWFMEKVRSPEPGQVQARGRVWGVGVSAGSQKLLRLVAELLEWPEVKEADLKNAISALNRRNPDKPKLS